ncbi:MAG: CPXCG motif-containing cysteine-rich protein [Longimicrobiales bacterium]
MFDELGSAAGDSEPEPFSTDLTDEATVWCPYCGESVEVGLDLGGGSVQEYVEDCQVCCRPWVVRVTVDSSGYPTVSVSTQDDS